MWSHHIIFIFYIFFFLFFTENRHLTDTQFRLSDNSNTQRQLNEAAFHAEMDLKAKQIEQKLEVGEIDIIHQDWVMYKFLDLQQLKEIFGRSIALQRIWNLRTFCDNFDVFNLDFLEILSENYVLIQCQHFLKRSLKERKKNIRWISWYVFCGKI